MCSELNKPRRKERFFSVGLFCLKLRPSTMTRIILSGGWGWRVARSSDKKSVRFTSVYLMKTEGIKGGVVFREKNFFDLIKTFCLDNLLSPSIFIFSYRKKDNFYLAFFLFNFPFSS